MCDHRVKSMSTITDTICNKDTRKTLAPHLLHLGGMRGEQHTLTQELTLKGNQMEIYLRGPACPRA